MNHKIFGDSVTYTLQRNDLIALINYCLQKNAETQTQLPEFLNIKQLSSYLNYSEPAIYKMVAHSEIPCYKISGKLLFKRIEIENWLFEYKQPTIKSQISALEDNCK